MKATKNEVESEDKDGHGSAKRLPLILNDDHDLFACSLPHI